jgi:catechol 2,3-dioxygenase-like lactoylglutathione lyase family enzyme
LLHHISIGVADLTASGTFYDAVLAPLGYVRVWEDIRPGEQHQAIGYGLPGGGDKLALKHRDAEQLHPGPGFHLALSAPSQVAVDEFHAAGIAHGATDRGGPKVWSEFGDTYYAAYLIDPDGWQLEAVHK